MGLSASPEASRESLLDPPVKTRTVGGITDWIAGGTDSFPVRTEGVFQPTGKPAGSVGPRCQGRGTVQAQSSRTPAEPPMVADDLIGLDNQPERIGAHSGGEEEYHFPWYIVKNDVAAGGGALSSLIGWARTNW